MTVHSGVNLGLQLGTPLGTWRKTWDFWRTSRAAETRKALEIQGFSPERETGLEPATLSLGNRLW